jgi:transcriptional regulator with XRE-family HTH domain
MPRDDVRRAELAAFLRARRARLSPADVGLRTHGRRRTAGLRREEVALLADVGVTWYTWLEQARPVRPSPSVLSAIAAALRLDPAEHDHLLMLGGVEPVLAEARPEPAERLLQHIGYPAWIISGRFDVLAHNRASTLVFGDVGALPEAARNVLWLQFTEPHWQQYLHGWDAEIRQFVALSRMTAAEHAGDPAWESLVADLRRHSPVFRRVWDDGQVTRWEPRRVAMQTGEGEIGFVTATYWLAPQRGSRMVVFTPADDAAEQALGRLRRSGAPPFTAWSDLARDGRGDAAHRDR